MITNAILLTVWHTTTKYALSGLEEHYARQGGRASYSHLNHAWRGKLLNADYVYTTYRDPYLVACSWVNRGHDLRKPGVNRTWVMQWRHYKELLKDGPIVLDFTKGRVQHGITFHVEPVNTSEDTKQMKKALKNNQMDYFYKQAPKELIDFAIDCCGELYVKTPE